MSARTYGLSREVACHQHNIALLRQRSLTDALEYALDAKAHYAQRGEALVSTEFLATAREIERELYPEAFTPPALPALPAPKSELPMVWVW